MPGFDAPPGPPEQVRLEKLLLRPPPEAARGLIGHILVRLGPDGALAVRIIETEAYLGERDPAAHAFRGRTARTEPLWGPVGTLYVYLIYGMHHCLNLAVDRPGAPGCVLIRAAEPLPGTPLPALACRGPGRLCRALGIDRTLSGRRLFEAAPLVTLREGPAPRRIGTSRRIGIRHAAERRLRFFDAESAVVSAARRGGVTSAVARAPRSRAATRSGPRRKNT